MVSCSFCAIISHRRRCCPSQLSASLRSKAHPRASRERFGKSASVSSTIGRFDDEDLQGRTRAQTGSRKDHRRCKFKYYQRRQSRSKYRNVYRCKGYPGNHDCKNMLYNPVLCTQSDATNMASISHFFKQETR
ncbi:hypothetical protein CABS03_01849 [Colletotrichum abscissum]|uniref:Uncharacterized protein n=1 Tax=Colletotrichum abscissum TaxID=1671311 RepID=A0A9Q0BAB6_9PEZI|nr:hypothetical protein CABS02_00613 [Colletotrichum abscissum]